MHSKIAAIVSAACIAASVSGCASFTHTNQAANEFVSAADALATAESNYFDEIQAASDASHHLRLLVAYTDHKLPFAKIVAESQKRPDFSKAKAARMAVMAQLQAYAKTIASIEGGENPSWIASDAKATIAGFEKVPADIGAKGLSDKDVGVAQTAVTVLGNVVVESVSVRELQSMATKAKPGLAAIHTMIDQDNDNIEKDGFAIGLVMDQSNAWMNTLHAVYDDPDVNAAQRFEVAVAALNAKPALITQGKVIAAALSKLEAANEALARKDHETAQQLAKDAYDLVKQALDAAKGK